MYKCSKCKEEKPDDNYTHNKDGKRTTSWCKECKRQAEIQRRLSQGVKPKKFSKIENGCKLCMECDKMVALDNFSPSTRGTGGLSAYCKPCTYPKYKNNEKSRIWTANYRLRNREIYLARHRVTQFNRKNKIKAVDDGTITPEFLKTLYGTENCHYCAKYTEESLRTMDHLIPLIKNGVHGISNLVMACLSCNCSKRSRTEEEFKDYKNKNAIL